jgi:hypothetical protein
MHLSAEFLGTAQSKNANVSAFVTVVKATVEQKRTMGDLAYSMVIKNNQNLTIFEVEYLREYESIFETALAHELVNPGVLFD